MEDIKTLLIGDIKSITIDSIIYLESGIEKEINLKECAINYANEYNSHIEDYITWEGQPAEPLKIEENRCIGERDWFADEPYFLFFSNPKVRFEIRYKKSFIDGLIKDYSKQKCYHQFFKIQMELQQFNWYTFDLG